MPAPLKTRSIEPATTNPKQDLVKKASQAQLSFIANQGQVNNDGVLYYAHTLGGTMFVTRTGELVYSLPKFEDSTAQDVSQSVYEQGRNDIVGKIDKIEGHKFKTRKITGGWALKEKLVGALAPIPQGTDQSGARINYFLGNDSSKWIIGATVHNTVSLGEVYPGIVMTLNAQGNNAEKVFTVKPGAKPEAIRVDIAGVTSLTVNSQGQLVAGTGLGPVNFTTPVAYQEQDGQRLNVSVVYRILDNHTYGFTVGKYNPALPLVIDPLAYSTYLGGSGDDNGIGIAVDSGGSAYVTGETYSTNFPTTPGALSQHDSGVYNDAFVTKLNSDGTLAYSTYLGGSNYDYGSGIAVDAGGSAYLTGATYSTNFPTTPGALSRHYSGGIWWGGDVFVTKLNPDGALAYSTYLGGSNVDLGDGIAVDVGGSAYVTGYTSSTDFPTTLGAVSQHDIGIYYEDAFVTKLNPDGTLAYSTYLGGSEADYGYGIAVGSGGSAYVTGATYSTDFPTTAGALSQHNNYEDAFVTKLNPDGTLAYSTYLGGSGDDNGYGIAVDSGGSIYVTGGTSSTDFQTTAGALSQHYSGVYGDAFVTKLNPDGTLAYSTYLGGSDKDVGEGIAVDAGGSIYVTGRTGSTDFPTTAGALSQHYNGAAWWGDAFVTKIAFNAISLYKSTLGRPSYCLFGHNSVNLSTGNFIDEATDFNIPSAGPPLAFTRFYNSQDDYVGTQGKGWTNNLNVHLNINTDGSIGVAYADGHVYTFIVSSDSYTAPSGCYETLTGNTDGTYTLAFKNHTKYIFNSIGQLISITDQNNNSIALTYNGYNLLDSATDQLDRSLTFAYDASNRLASITDPIGRTVSYTYDADGNLATVQDVDNGITRYQYDAHGLTKVIQPNNNAILTNTYDDSNRVPSQADGNGNTWTYAYTADQRTIQTGPLGETTAYTRDDRYRGIGIIDPLNGHTAFTYDDNNNCTSAKDANDKTDTYTYDSSGNLATHTDASGNITRYAYDSNNNLTSVEEGYGTADSRTTTYAYDSHNNLTGITDTGGATTTYQYYPDSASHPLKGLLWRQTSPGTGAGQGTVTYTYDDNCYPATVTGAAGITTTDSYDPVGRLLTSAEGGRTTAYTYDAAGNQLSVTDPLGHTISYTYDANGNRVRANDPRDGSDRLTSYAYDGNNLLTAKTDPLNGVTRYAYDAEQRLQALTDANGHTTTYTYDDAGRLTATTDPLGHTTGSVYDAVGNLLSRTDAYGKTVATYEYDQLYNVTSVMDALGNTTGYTYDPQNQNQSLKQVTDPMGNTITYTNDRRNQMTGSTDANGASAGQTYDSDGNVTSVSDLNGNQTQLHYDQADRITGKTLPAGGSLACSYNDRGLPAWSDNARGQRTTYNSYDGNNRLTSLTDPAGTVAYTYDTGGNLLTVSDASGAITRTYDALNRVTNYTDARGNTTGYQYDKVGNLTQLTYPDGKSVQYTYDADNRLVSVTDWANRTTGYAYDDDGRLTGITRPDGSAQSLAYYDNGWLREQKDLDRNGQVISQYDLIYDQNGSITRIDTATPTQPFVQNDAAIVYDSKDNRATSYNGQVIIYDDDGNMTTGPLNGQMTQYSFNARSELTGVGAATYQYDAEGNRTGITEGTSQTSYVVSPGSLSQVLTKTDANGQTDYIYGLSLIGQEDAGGYRTYHYDYRGNTVALTDASGNVTDCYQYEPFGTLTYRSGSVNTPFLFDGRDGVMTDANGLLYMRARYYSPEARRFISRDVITGSIGNPQSLNSYSYGGSNPLINIDPSGCVTFTIGNPIEPVQTFDEYFKYDPNAKATVADRISWTKWGAMSLGAKIFKNMPDAVAAYNNYRSNTGTDLQIDYEKAYREDAVIKSYINQLLYNAQIQAMQLRINSGLSSFNITSDLYSIPNGVTENWQKTIGAHYVWASASVTYRKGVYTMNITIHMKDRYNFNKGMSDIASGTPDEVNGRFAVFGWAKSFFTIGQLNRTLVWEGNPTLPPEKTENNSR